MSYEKIKAVLVHAKDSNSLSELLKKLEEDSAFFYGKKKKVLIRRQRKQYIDNCVKLGFLNGDHQLTDLGNKALQNYNNTLSQVIFDMEIEGKKFKDILLLVLSDVDIPTTEQIYKKMSQSQVDMPINQLRNYLNILAKCGVLQKNRKYTYTLVKVNVNDFEAILKEEYHTIEKDPSGLIWYEHSKENIQKKYALSSSQFDELFAKLKKKKPRLISLQRSRTKTWLLLREV